MADTERRQKLPIHNSPRVVAIFPWITTPDTKFNEGGIYKTDGRTDSDKAAPVLKIIETQMAVAKAEAEVKAKENTAKTKKKVTATLHKDGTPHFAALNDQGEETGDVVFKFRANASFVDKKTGKTIKRTIPLFDAKGKPMPPKAIFGGSMLIVSYTAAPWVNPSCEYGVKLRMEAVQVIDLVTSGSKSASGYGFEEQDDGYVHEDDADAAHHNAPAGEDESDF